MTPEELVAARYEKFRTIAQFYKTESRKSNPPLSFPKQIPPEPQPPESPYNGVFSSSAIHKKERVGSLR